MSPPDDKKNGESENGPPTTHQVAEAVEAEPVTRVDPERLRHLGDNRALIVKRALLSSALGGALPVPILDDYFATRIRAGLLMKLASTRNVGLTGAAAEVLSEARGGSTLRNATMTAATLIALKLAWRKFFTLLAAGRGAEEAATTYQSALLFDHYCARIHTGGEITRNRAAALNSSIATTVRDSNKGALVAVFRDGGRILGRSLLQAPRWARMKLSGLAERFVLSRGNPDIDIEMPAAGDNQDEDTAWLDSASAAVEERLAAMGNDYLGGLVDRFETNWRAVESKAEQDQPEPAE